MSDKGIITPNDLSSTDATLYVQNMTGSVISHEGDQPNERLVLTPKGSIDSLQILPRTVAMAPGFQRLWRLGKVVVSTDPDLNGEVERLEKMSEDKKKAESESVKGLIKEDPSKDFLVPTTSTDKGVGQSFQRAGQVKEK